MSSSASVAKLNVADWGNPEDLKEMRNENECGGVLPAGVADSIDHSPGIENIPFRAIWNRRSTRFHGPYTGKQL